jgi:hypothetical protein
MKLFSTDCHATAPTSLSTAVTRSLDLSSPDANIFSTRPMTFFGPRPVGLGQIVKITVPPVSPHEGHDSEKSAPDFDD